MIDPYGYISFRLYRDQCVIYHGFLVKDLSMLGRDLASVIIVDNAADSYMLQQQNGIECQPYLGNGSDRELDNIQPFLQYLSKKSV